MDRLKVVEPDFLYDIWEHLVKEGKGERLENQESDEEMKTW